MALGHQRLAIVDLSDAGVQPMISASGRYVMVLNGEIYNFRELRARLTEAGVTTWRGSSDTEVLLHGIERWGLESTLATSDGMFAFAVWDKHERRLCLARDRFGEKPLIVARTEWGLAFCSQLGGLLTLPGFVGELDETAIDQFLALSYVPEPKTPFRDAFKLPPGTYCMVSPGDRSIAPVTYWSASRAAAGARAQLARTEDEVREVKAAIEARFLKAVGNQMLADVPLGAFLSGGIDSSLVVAAMQEQSTRPVKTFTISFEEEAYNEGNHARAVAGHLATDHEETVLSWRQALELVPQLPEFYDEPFADSSQLPTYLVSRVARQKVTVALTGDAGDEVFGGYNRHVVAARYGGVIEATPSVLRGAIGSVLAGAAGARALKAAGLGSNSRLLSEKISKFAAMLRAGDRFDLYQSLVRRDDSLLPGDGVTDAMRAKHDEVSAQALPLPEYMMLMDALTYLPGDILTKVDRASMAVALETRAPFLDHRLFELAWRLPSSEHIKDGRSKSVLREMLARRMPARLFERPKAGFGVPISDWMRGPLSAWLMDAANGFKLAYPRHQLAIDRALAALCDGSPTIHHFLWNVAMLEGWRRRRLGPAAQRLASPVLTA